MEEYQFKHFDEWFYEFIYAPQKFTLLECHNVNYLKQLLKDESIFIKNRDRKKIINYIQKTVTNVHGLRRKAVPFEYIKKTFSGKYIPKRSFQFMEKWLKTRIYIHDNYLSLDISNRGYTIINELANLNGIHLPMINQMVNNREEIYRKHSNYWNDSKCGFLDLIINSSYRERQTKFIKKLIDEINFVKKLFRHKDFPCFSLSNIIEIYSQKIMQIISEYLILNGIILKDFYSLNGDEILFQPQKPFRIEEIEDYVFEKSKFRIKLH